MSSWLMRQGTENRRLNNSIKQEVSELQKQMDENRIIHEQKEKFMQEKEIRDFC